MREFRIRAMIIPDMSYEAEVVYLGRGERWTHHEHKALTFATPGLAMGCLARVKKADYRVQSVNLEYLVQHWKQVTGEMIQRGTDPD